jgi:hypothetical protein
LLVAGLAVIAATGGYVAVQRTGGDQQVLADRQAEVAAKGREVMPFDLDRTTHQFAKLPTGGLQTVTSDDPADAEQVKLIRAHLAEEAKGFSAGDYGDPATIHGAEMPGLRELEQGHARIEIRYADTPSGAQITYTTAEPVLVTALHSWFDAQVSDHGPHAEH